MFHGVVYPKNPMAFPWIGQIIMDPLIIKIPPTRPLRQRQHLGGSPPLGLFHTWLGSPHPPIFGVFSHKRGEIQGPKAQMSLVYLVESPKWTCEIREP